MSDGVWIAVAFALGFGARMLGLPALVGYLLAGFALTALAPQLTLLGLPSGGGAALEHLAHLGVLLLLFTVGLKLKLKALFRAEVIGGGLAHFAISCLVLTPALVWLLGLDLGTAALLACALSFSSTVLAAKVLEAKRELRAFHGRVAIGILIVQDLIAMGVLSAASGTSPSPWALLVFALPLLRPLLFKLLDAIGHDELLILLGLLLALVVGGYGFEAVGLSSELGALLFGAMLSSHPRSNELSNALWSVKEVFLVGFFLQIGMEGLPDTSAFVFAFVMVALLPLKWLGFFLLLVAFKLRARSAFLTSLSLTNYSEFGLIVASVVLPQWLIPLAVTVALSFMVSAPLNRMAHPLYERLSSRLARHERRAFHRDEQPLSVGDARILIAGMGRTGTAAYDHLVAHEPRVVGLESDPAKVEAHQASGRRVLFADAEDPVFWQQLGMERVHSVMLCMNDIEAKVLSAQQLRRRSFEGLVISHTLYADEATKICSAGADHTYLTMSQAGVGLAERVLSGGRGMRDGS